MDEESVLKTPAGEIHRQEFDSLSLRLWEVGEAGAHVPLKTARRRFNPVTSHSLPHSSMAERSPVKREVAGSSPAGAAIHCRVDDMESRCDSGITETLVSPNGDATRTTPASASIFFANE